MFMTIWKPIVKSKAQKFNFLLNGISLSKEVSFEYDAIKKHFNKIYELMENKLDEKNSVLIMKEMLGFYQLSENLIENLLNEIFRDNFDRFIIQKIAIFEILNKLLKLFISFDLIKIKAPDVFDMYSKHKILELEALLDLVTDQEDDRITILGMICLPMGRMFLSMFSSNKFDIKNADFLSKKSKIHLNSSRQKKLCFYGFLAYKYKLKYLALYIECIFKKLFNENLSEEDINSNKHLSEYFELLENHL